MKKNPMKRPIALALALILLFSLQAAALAAFPAETGELEADYTGKTVILHTNDVHGEVSGYAKIAALRKELEARGAEVLLADAGDFSQGDPYVNRTQGRDAVDLMNAAGYTLATVGNREFDFGVDALLENVRTADFPLLCANILRDGETLCQTRLLYTGKSGLKLGFVGLTTPETMTATTPTLVKELTFIRDEAFMTLAQGEIDALREEGADLVIALTHLGVEYLPGCPLSSDLYAGTTGLDFIIDGHSHTVLTAGEKGEPIQSTGTKFQYIGVIVIDNAGKRIEDNFLLPTEGLTADETVLALEQTIEERVDKELMVTIATSEVELEGAKSVNRTRESNSGDLITDALLWYARNSGEEFRVEDDHLVALLNGGGIRAAIHPGEVTQKDVMTVQPYGDNAHLVYVTGAQLLEALEAGTFCVPEPSAGYPQTAGIRWSLDLSKEFDEGEAYPDSAFHAPASIRRVRIESVNGRPFAPEDIYAIVTNAFCASGGDTYGVLATCESYDLCVRMDDVLMRYIREGLGGVISAEGYGQARGEQRQIQAVSAVFTDVEAGAWYAKELQSAYADGLISGRTETEFAPDAPLTRAELAAILWRLAGEPEAEGSMTFADVPGDAWYNKALAWATAKGFRLGDEEGSFRPDEPCTREKLADVLYRYVQYEGGGFRGMWMFLLDASDREQISDWAYEPFCWLTMHGVIRGMEKGVMVLAPKAVATRAQAAVMLARLREVLNAE